MPGIAIPAGYRLKMTLQNDSSGNVTGVTWVVTDNLGKTLANNTQPVPGLPADLAPIIAFELNLIGPISGESAVLASGAGAFSYRASSPLTALNKEPPCAETKVRTGEAINSLYGVLPSNPANPLVQSFIAS